MMSQTIPDPFFNTQTSSFFTQDDYLAPFINQESVLEVGPEAEAYCEVIREQSIEGLTTLREMADRSGEDEMVVKYVYGIITEVYESDISKFKHIKIVDPSMEDGIEIMSLRRNEAVKVQQMVKFENLELQSPNYVVSNITTIQYIPLFMYDYSEPANDSKNEILRQSSFKKPEDIKICRKLEEWYSQRIMATSLSNLPPPGSRTYVNLCCQVLAYNKNQACINALVWDTTTPKHTPTPWSDTQRYPTSLETFNFIYFPVACGKYFPVTIWNGHEQANHYDIFKCLTLENLDDLVVLFNIEVTKDQKSNGVCLAMRSSRRYGKAVRVVRPSSLLGHMFRKRLEAYRVNFYSKIDVGHTYSNSCVPESRRESPRNNVLSSTIIERVNDSKLVDKKDIVIFDSIPGLEQTIQTAEEDKVIEVQVKTNGDMIEDIRVVEQNLSQFNCQENTFDDQMQSDDETSVSSLPIKRIEIGCGNLLNSPTRYFLIILRSDQYIDLISGQYLRR